MSNMLEMKPRGVRSTIQGLSCVASKISKNSIAQIIRSTTMMTICSILHSIHISHLSLARTMEGKLQISME
jgi:hypothetical protein